MQFDDFELAHIRAFDPDFEPMMSAPKTKMSKSLNNFIGLTEPPIVQFTKTMSIHDSLMWNWMDLLGDVLGVPDVMAFHIHMDVISGKIHPKKAKMFLAWAIVCKFHSAELADLAQKEWEKQFTKKEMPEDAPFFATETAIKLPKALVECKLAKSTSAARQLIKDGAVFVDENQIKDIEFEINSFHVLKVGKHSWAKIVVWN